MNNVYVPNVTVTLKVTVCANCATHFAIDEILYYKVPIHVSISHMETIKKIYNAPRPCTLNGL